MKKLKKSEQLLGTNVLIERDGSSFLVSVPGIQGAHADGDTLEQALSNLKEVVSLLKEFHGERKFLRIIQREQRFLGVINYNLEYA